MGVDVLAADCGQEVMRTVMGVVRAHVYHWNESVGDVVEGLHLRDVRLVLQTHVRQREVYREETLI